MPAMRRRVLILTADTVGERRAGPAIRAWEMATALAAEHDVVLGVGGDCTVTSPDFSALHVDRTNLPGLVDSADVVVMQGSIMRHYPGWARADTVFVADMYDPFHLESLELERHEPFERRQDALNAAVEVLNAQLARADHVMCASQKQRDFWLGQLAGIGRVNPHTYDADERLDNFVSVVPFGLQEQAPVRTRPAIKGVVDGIGPNDKVILWGGGVYNWFDPLTLLHAVDKLSRRRPDVRLFFLGMKHPHPGVPQMRMAAQTRALAVELGMLDKYVFFNEEWVAYDDRQNYLLDSDIGVSCHLDHVETQFSFRTRILDYIWAGLPIVSTRGDTLGALLEERGMGFAVPPNDSDTLAEVLGRLLDDGDLADRCRANVRDVAAGLTWSRVLEPLLEFCRDPRRAPDLVDPAVLFPNPVFKKRGRYGRLAQRAKRVYARDGAQGLARWGAGKVARRLARAAGR